MLHLYPYKLQSLHQNMPAGIAARKSFVKWALTKTEREITVIGLWTEEAHFEEYRQVNKNNSSIWAASNPREHATKPFHSPREIVWCGFIDSSVVSSFYFEERCPISGWKTCTVTAKWHLSLLNEKVVPALQARGFYSKFHARWWPRLRLSIRVFLKRVKGCSYVIKFHLRYV